jgi:hypothetical protein
MHICRPFFTFSIFPASDAKDILQSSSPAAVAAAALRFAFW